MKKIKKADLFLLYLSVLLGIGCLRFFRGYPAILIKLFNSFVTLSENMVNYFGLTQLAVFLQNVPTRGLLILIGVMQISIGFVILFLFRSTIEQGTALLLQKSSAVMKTGSILYAMIFAVIIVFIYSVVGLPIGGIFVILLHIFIMLGKMPIAVFCGYSLLEQFHIKAETYLYYLTGSFVMLLFESVYMIGNAFLFFIFPVMALGVDMLLFLYRFVYQCSLPVEFLEKKDFDRKKMRDIIKKDL